MEETRLLPKRSLDIVIVGGSIAGLMCGTALRETGHHITIIDQASDHRESHMAGVCLGLDGKRWLSQFDEMQTPFTLRSSRLQLLNRAGKASMFVPVPREVTSWDSLYYRLRSLYDGFLSNYYPQVSRKTDLLVSDNAASYLSETRVLDIQRQDDHRMRVTIENTSSGEVSTRDTDFVIGADGPNSFVRQKYLPKCKRQYVGYIAWRGVVPEHELSQETRDTFAKDVTIYMQGRHHCLVYCIPGDDGSLENRYMNFLWYTNESPSDVQSIMTDSDGHRHRYTLPRGKVQSSVWEAQLRRAQAMPLPPPFLEVIGKIKQPFVQVITEHCASRAVWEDGKVILVGDALTLFRPHTAFSATQAAFDAMQLVDHVSGRIGSRALEKRLLEFGRLHFLQSVWYGEFYQGSIFTALRSAVRYWVACALAKVRAWWKGEECLLRTTQSLDLKA